MFFFSEDQYLNLDLISIFSWKEKQYLEFF